LEAAFVLGGLPEDLPVDHRAQVEDGGRLVGLEEEGRLVGLEEEGADYSGDVENRTGRSHKMAGQVEDLVVDNAHSRNLHNSEAAETNLLDRIDIFSEYPKAQQWMR
jgi:hypothetical protein